MYSLNVIKTLNFRNRQDEINRLDAEKIDFHTRVYQGYQALIAQEPQRWVIINANHPVNDVAEQIRAVLEMRLKSWGGSTS